MKLQFWASIASVPSGGADVSVPSDSDFLPPGELVAPDLATCNAATSRHGHVGI